MPSFDVVSKVDKQEVINAVDQANREVETRFDFKGTNAKFELSQNKIMMIGPNDFQLKQMHEIIINKITKRNIDVRSLHLKSANISLHEAKQEIEIKQGISAETAKKIIKAIKDSKLKVQASIQGEQIRVSGKKRDDLQDTIAFLRKQDFQLPLQYENFRD